MTKKDYPDWLSYLLLAIIFALLVTAVVLPSHLGASVENFAALAAGAVALSGASKTLQGAERISQSVKDRLDGLATGAGLLGVAWGLVGAGKLATIFS